MIDKSWLTPENGFVDGVALRVTKYHTLLSPGLDYYDCTFDKDYFDQYGVIYFGRDGEDEDWVLRLSDIESIRVLISYCHHIPIVPHGSHERRTKMPDSQAR